MRTILIFISTSNLLLAFWCSYCFSFSTSPPTHTSNNNPISPTITTTRTSAEKTTIMQNALSGKMILAPLTRGGNLPFRRLCADFGMEISLSEMIYARQLLRGDTIEYARLRRATNECFFGVQIATNTIEEGLGAIQKAQEAGADFVDLNCGCPIHEATRRGLGSSLLRSPKKLGKLVNGLVDGSNIPITVKIRLGCETESINCSEVVRTIREAGAAAITIHGRTAQQGYSKNADWTLIQKAVQDGKEQGYGDIPVIGNGDILTYYEARRRMEETSVDSVMVGRGALCKPWIFKEFNENQTWSPDMYERIDVYYTLTNYMKDHFGKDDMGRKKSWYFLPWHFEFLSRYTPYPEDLYSAQSIERPLIQSRIIPSVDDLSPLEILFSNRCSDTHNLIANILWESASSHEAVQKLKVLAESDEFKHILFNGGSSPKEDKVLTNMPIVGKKATGNWQKRRGRNPAPKRSEEEISQIRAERAAKKANYLAEGKPWPPV